MMAQPQREFVYTGHHQRRPLKGRRPSLTRPLVLAFIRAEIAAMRPFPTPTAIRKHMGWANITSACDALRGLKVDGHLRTRIDEDGHRGWELTQ
jgi:hypothetical protein